MGLDEVAEVRDLGAESAFAVKMTAAARSLGMSSTTFRNASGLPDPNQMTTARDMSLLGRALQDRFPNYFSYFSTSSFVFQGRRIGNHNYLLGRIAGVNGIKTGYTRASGYNLVTSATKNGRRVVGVVMGEETAEIRDDKMASLLDTYLTPAATTATVSTDAARQSSAN